MKTDINIEKITKQLLSIFKSGVYLTNHDFIQIGKKYGINLEYKNRTFVVKKLLTEALQKKILEKVYTEIESLIDTRITEYEEYCKDYTSLKTILKYHISNALHVKVFK